VIGSHADRDDGRWVVSAGILACCACRGRRSRACCAPFQNSDYKVGFNQIRPAPKPGMVWDYGGATLVKVQELQRFGDEAGKGILLGFTGGEIGPDEESGGDIGKGGIVTRGGADDCTINVSVRRVWGRE